MPQAPSTGFSLIRDPSIAPRNTQILWTEADRDLAQDTRFTGMKHLGSQRQCEALGKLYLNSTSPLEGKGRKKHEYKKSVGRSGVILEFYAKILSRTGASGELE